MRFTTILLAALVAAAPSSHAETLAGPYQARVLRVIDGDTVEASVRVWLGFDLTTRVRLRGVAAPELNTPCGPAAREALARLVGEGAVTLVRIGHDKYGGRIDAVLLLPSGQDAAAALRALSHCP